jgi:hypothetical protein
MRGGVIHVNDRIQDLNKTLKGEKIYYLGEFIDPWALEWYFD